MADLVQGLGGAIRVDGPGIEWLDLEFTSAANFAAASNAAIDLSVQIRGRSIGGSPYGAGGLGIGAAAPKVPRSLAILGWYSLTTDYIAITSGTITASVGAVAVAYASLRSLYQFDSTGLLTLAITTTTNTRRFNFAMPDGRIISSPTLTWT